MNDLPPQYINLKNCQKYFLKLKQVQAHVSSDRHLHTMSFTYIFLVCIHAAYKVVLFYFCLMVTPTLVNQSP